MLVVHLIGVYLVVGLIVAIAFVLVGIARVMGGPVALTPGARLLLIPGALALWPLVVCRWLRAGSAP